MACNCSSSRGSIYQQFLGARRTAFMQPWREYCDTANVYPNGTVFYTGPCPPPPCYDKCGNPQACPYPWPFPPEPRYPVYGRFENTGTLSLEAGAQIPLDDEVFTIGDISVSGAVVTIGHDGVYLVSVALSGTATGAIDTRIRLCVDGEPLDCPRLKIRASQGETISEYGQTQIEALAGMRLRLITEGALSIVGTPNTTLSVTRLE